MTQPLLLDLFARAQGSSVGYARSGFRVTAGDKDPYAKHPEVAEWITADAFDVLADLKFCRRFDVITASPNCEGYSDLHHLPTTAHRDREIPQVREALRRIGKPYVIENVDSKATRAVMLDPLRLCGSQFNLGSGCRDGQWRELRRHRLFEFSWQGYKTNFKCKHYPFTGGVYGTGGGGPQTRGYRFYPEEARTAMGISWMHRDDICKAVPPAYTWRIGTMAIQWFDLG